MPTRRQSISEILQSGPVTARDLARRTGVPIKATLEDLHHIERSLKGTKRFVIREAECLSCGHRFRKRERLSSPSRCFVCRSERIREPEFSIAEG